MNHPLLQKASIVFTPTAYGTSTLNSIKPVYTLGTELVTNGTFDTDMSLKHSIVLECCNLQVAH